MSSNYMQNREISWLRFNERVLDEASSYKVKPLEKLKFISIFTSNLTEFFMVRIGSLTDLSKLKKEFTDNKTGMTASEQIKASLDMLPDMYLKKDSLFKSVSNELSEFGIIKKNIKNLNSDELKYIKEFFEIEVLPIISPQIIDSAHPFPFIENDQLYIFIEMQNKKKKCYGLIPVRSNFPKYLVLPSIDKFYFIMTEDIILHFADLLFSKLIITTKSVINVTRNFDLMETNEIRDEFEDYKNYMKAVIKRRKRLQAVRLESNIPLSKDMALFLQKQLGLPKENFFVSKSPLKLDYTFSLIDNIPAATKEKITNKSFTSFYKCPVEYKNSMISFIENKDVMLYYPYDDIKFFLDLMKEASTDPKVVSIQITIYRLAKNSKLVKYLCDASESGKSVTVFMELKARFDEENNINYSDILYESGCNIIYGFEQFKTHSKLCLITYKDKREIKFITQIGTGNYNEFTSKLYTDLSLITANKEIGLDASDFFKNISIGNTSGRYVHLLQSPHSLKVRVLNLMESERKKGEEGQIFLKINSLTDKNIIEKLKECSIAGVKVKMIIRGISCLLPSVEGVTDNIEIHSIVGRFLEHARIYIFGKGSSKRYYISSADFMTRNMERRIEVAVPIYDENIKFEIDEYFAIQFNDNVKGRRMSSNGEYKIISNKKNTLSSQEYFMKKANDNFLKVYDNSTLKKEQRSFLFIKEFFKNLFGF